MPNEAVFIGELVLAIGSSASVQWAGDWAFRGAAPQDAEGTADTNRRPYDLL